MSTQFHEERDEEEEGSWRGVSVSAHEETIPNAYAYGEMSLFFGCRNKDKDFLFQSYVEQMHQTRILKGLHCAFSRDGPDKVYVQHLMRAQGSQIVDTMLNHKGCLYVCGYAIP